jgi:hypothetical protein
LSAENAKVAASVHWKPSFRMSCQRAEILDKAAVIPGEPEEAPQRTCRRRLRPRRDGRDLILVRGNPGGQDHMAEVGDGVGGEPALGPLDAELMIP